MHEQSDFCDVRFLMIPFNDTADIKEESIPVGSVPPARKGAEGGGVGGGGCCPGGSAVQEWGAVQEGRCCLWVVLSTTGSDLITPPLCIQNEWHMLLKILHCLKLRLRAVMTIHLKYFEEKVGNIATRIFHCAFFSLVGRYIHISPRFGACLPTDVLSAPWYWRTGGTGDYAWKRRSGRNVSFVIAFI